MLRPHGPVQSDPQRIENALSLQWDRVKYESFYGAKAALAMERCRKAARENNMPTLIAASHILSNVMYTEGRW